MGRGLQVWKLHLKISPWDEKPCLPRAYGPWEASFSSRGLIFGGEEISIPEIRPIRKSYIYYFQGLNVICATLKGQVYNLKMDKNGTEIWCINLDSPIFSTPLVIPPCIANYKETTTSILVSTVKGAIYKIDLKTKDILWTLNTHMHVFAPLSLIDIYACVGSREGKIHAIDISKGSIQWSLTMEKPINAGICKMSTNETIVVDNRANFKLIRPSDGFELFHGSLNIGETFSTPLMCSTANVLLIGSRDDNLYCFSLEKK
jgi:outer membrane protein assembly factor BamB